MLKLLRPNIVHCTHNFPMAYTYGTSSFYIDSCSHGGINTEFSMCYTGAAALNNLFNATAQAWLVHTSCTSTAHIQRHK